MKKDNKGFNKDGIKSLFITYPVTTFSVVVCLVMCIVMLFYNPKIAIAEFLVVIALIVAAALIKNSEFKRLKGAVSALERNVSVDENGDLKSFPLPVLLFDSTERAVWYNTLFKNNFLINKDVNSIDIKQFTSGQGIEIIRENIFIECEYEDKKYTAFSGKTEYKNEIVYALYFVEDTELKSYRTAFENSRPVIMLVSVDGVEDSLREFRESQQAEIVSGVETIIENWFARFNCISRKVNNGRVIAIGEIESLKRMKEDKFSILSQVRSYCYNDKNLGISLSIGIGSGNSLSKSEETARQALDMAMGRGGDQAAIKTDKNDFEFFGGVAKGVQKRTKVRTRMVAAAIGEIIKSSNNVLIMGHRYADLDALGSAVGVSMIASALNIDSKIVMSSETTLAMPLAKHLISNGFDNLLIEPDDVDSYLTNNTLLVIVDTHRKTFLEYPELFDLVNRVVVIDHHRKTVDHINKALVFYHEPNSSSASEMVTELIQYIPFDVSIPKVCAEALMSGITLDTKNFVMKTGVRTFEAAAYLRSLGADTVSVKQLFSNSMKTQKDKSEVVKNAVIYNCCAIGVVDFEADDVRIVASQAADELLNIADVDASFVLFKVVDEINISARSYGELNVQLVMEELGGGGHQTMAAAQIQDESFDGVLKQLSIAIDKIKDTK